MLPVIAALRSVRCCLPSDFPLKGNASSCSQASCRGDAHRPAAGVCGRPPWITLPAGHWILFEGNIFVVFSHASEAMCSPVCCHICAQIA